MVLGQRKRSEGSEMILGPTYCKLEYKSKEEASGRCVRQEAGVGE